MPPASIFSSPGWSHCPEYSDDRFLHVRPNDRVAACRGDRHAEGGVDLVEIVFAGRAGLQISAIARVVGVTADQIDLACPKR